MKYRVRKTRVAALVLLAGAVAVGGYACGYDKASKAAAAEVESVPVVLSSGNVYTDYESLGEFVITYYCACEKCCGEFADGVTATGTKAQAGRTIAVDPEVIPYGTMVIIDGHTYVAEDCGGAIKGNRIDIFMSSHREALAAGVQIKEVWVEK